MIQYLILTFPKLFLFDQSEQNIYTGMCFINIFPPPVF